MTTKEIEHIAYNYFWKKGVYLLYEMAVPKSIINKYHRERVDLISYETSGIFRAYEIKRNKADFHSKSKWSWIGNYNYFIMPNTLYEQIKDEVPDGIGVWVCYEDRKYMTCVKRPKYRNLLCSKEDLLFAMMQGLSREYKKYRKILEKEKVKKRKS